MADEFGAVSEDIKARTKALLEAVASGGTQGLRAYEQGQTALTTARQQSIDRAAQRAALIGGPEAQGFEGLAAGQFDRRIGDLGAARSVFEADVARRGGAFKNYLDQVGGAIPLVRADADRQIALARAEAASKGAAGGSLSDSELRVRLLGAGRRAFEEAGRFDPPSVRGQELLPVAGPTLTGKPLPPVPNPLFGKSPESFARDIGVDAGLDPSLVSGLINLPKPAAAPKPAVSVKNIMTWAKTDEKTASTISKDPDYRAARASASDWLTVELDKDGLIKSGDYKGMTPWEAFVDQMTAEFAAGKPRTLRALLTEYEPVFRSSKRR